MVDDKTEYELGDVRINGDRAEILTGVGSSSSQHREIWADYFKHHEDCCTVWVHVNCADDKSKIKKVKMTLTQLREYLKKRAKWNQ